MATCLWMNLALTATRAGDSSSHFNALDQSDATCGQTLSVHASMQCCPFLQEHASASFDTARRPKPKLQLTFFSNHADCACLLEILQMDVAQRVWTGPVQVRCDPPTAVAAGEV